MCKHPKVFVLTKDLELAQKLIPGLFALGIDPFWVTEISLEPKMATEVRSLTPAEMIDHVQAPPATTSSACGRSIWRRCYQQSLLAGCRAHDVG